MLTRLWGNCRLEQHTLLARAMVRNGPNLPREIPDAHYQFTKSADQECR